MRYSRSEQQITCLASRKVVLERNHVHNPGKPLVNASPEWTLIKRTWPSHEDARHRLLQPPHVLPKAGQRGAGRRCGRTPMRPARMRPAVLACLPLTTSRRGILLMPFACCQPAYLPAHANAPTLAITSRASRRGYRSSCIATHRPFKQPEDLETLLCHEAHVQSVLGNVQMHCKQKHCKALCTCSACLHQTCVTCIK